MDIPTVELFNEVALIEGKMDAVNQKTSYLFNWHDFFGVDENRMSDILAFLLDPKEKHGQGDLYLDAFLELFELPPAIAEDCISVSRERGRIDVLLEIGKTGYILENKYRGAVDQTCQIDRYVDFCLKGGKELANIYVLYLGNGGEPSPDSLNKYSGDMKNGGRLKCLAFSATAGRAIDDYTGRTVADFVRVALQRTQSIKMRFFLEDLLDHIEGDRTLDQFEMEFFRFLDSDENRIEQARKVHELYERYRAARWKDFIGALVQRVRDVAGKELPGWLCEVDGGFGESSKKAIRLLKASWRSSGYNIRLHPYGACMGDLYMTIGKNQGLRTDSEAKVAAAVGLEYGGKDDDLSQVGWKWIDLQRPEFWRDVRLTLPAHRDKVIHAWTDVLVELARNAEAKIDELVGPRVGQL